MNILFLGPECPSLESYLIQSGHHVRRLENGLSHKMASQADFAISYRYRHIIPPDLIGIFQGRLINLHISLLPWNRGADPNLWSFLEDTPKGVSIHQIDAGIDTGPILVQENTAFDCARDTLRSTYAQLSTQLENLFRDNAPALLAGSLRPRQQPPGGSFHSLNDKLPYLRLIEKAWWDTPVSALAGKARERERERER